MADDSNEFENEEAVLLAELAGIQGFTSVHVIGVRDKILNVCIVAADETPQEYISDAISRALARLREVDGVALVVQPNLPGEKLNFDRC